MPKRSFNRPPSGYTQYPSETLPERWPLATLTQPRDTDYTKDARLINCYVELDPQDQEYIVEQRPGYGQAFSYAVGQGRGHFNWRPSTGPVGAGGLYSTIGSNVYKNAVLFGAVGGSGNYCFEPMLEGPYLFFHNGISAYYTNGAVLTPVVDADFPTDFCLGAAYLNTRMYVIRFDGGIQGSDSGAPGSWDPLNVIFARNNPDGGVSIAKQLSYIIAMKQWTTEFFEDVGNPTGSVLQVIDGAMLNYGCSDARTSVELDGIQLWVTASKDAAPQVGRLDNLTFKIISTPPIERLLRVVANFAIIDVNAFPLKVAGHRWYVLNIETLPFSLVYDLDQNFWYYWSDPQSGGLWPFGSCTSVGNNVLLQRFDNGTQATCDGDYVYPTDFGLCPVVDIYTPNFDYIVDRVKQLNMLYINADQHVGSILQARYSDDDYQTWSNWRTIDLGQIKPFLDNEGSFYRRAYNFRHASPTPFRIRSSGMQIDIGTG